MTANEIAVDALLGGPAVQAGLEAMERIHGRHLTDMSPQERDEARAHWREQVEQVLAGVHAVLSGPPPAGAGRATITFSDAGAETVEVSVAFSPEPVELPDGSVEATPAQMLAMNALDALADDAEPG